MFKPRREVTDNITRSDVVRTLPSFFSKFGIHSRPMSVSIAPKAKTNPINSALRTPPKNVEFMYAVNATFHANKKDNTNVLFASLSLRKSILKFYHVRLLYAKKYGDYERSLCRFL